MNKMKMSKSPWVLHYDGSSCNGCDIEVLASTTPVYDIERFGIINTGDPKHADVFLITGGVNYQNRSVVQQLYSQMPDPKVVVAVGICACDGGIFKDCYNILGGVDKVIPVDVYVPGCAARPESIIDGVVKALDILEQKRERMQQGLPAEERSAVGMMLEAVSPDADEKTGGVFDNYNEQAGSGEVSAPVASESDAVQSGTGRDSRRSVNAATSFVELSEAALEKPELQRKAAEEASRESEETVHE